MYLTRMYLNPARRGTRKLMASPQNMHAAVLTGFPPTVPPVGPEGRVLWRVDRGKSHELTLWVSSPTAPQLTCVVEQAGWENQAEQWQTADCRPFLERLQVGQRWMFRLTANPVHRPRAESGRSRPLAHVTAAQQAGWLLDRAETNGFFIPNAPMDVPDFAVVDRKKLTFPRGHDGDRRMVTLAIATYDGVLEVADVELLRRALINGIGRAKGYGCGLLTLAPAL